MADTKSIVFDISEAKTEEQKIAFFREQIKNRLKYMMEAGFYVDWLLNRAFADFGEHFIWYDDLTNTMRKKTRGKLAYFQLPLVEDAVDIEQSRIATQPILDCVPLGADDDAAETARMWDELLLMLDRKTKFPKRRKVRNRGLLLYGTMFDLAYIDTTKGPYVPPDDGEKEGFHLGEPQCVTLTPFEILPNTDAEDEETLVDFFRVTIQPLHEIEEKYPGKLGDVKKSKIPRNLVIFNNKEGPTAQVTHEVIKKLPDGNLLVFEYYRRGSHKLPNGYAAHYCEGKLLWEGELELKDDDERGALPLTTYWRLKRSKCFWGIPYASKLRAINVAIDKTISRIAHAQKKGLRQSVVASRQAHLSKAAFAYPGVDLLEYDGVMQPTSLEYGQTPRDLYRNLELLLTQFMSHANHHEITRGSVPPGVRSGQAMMRLKEYEDIPIQVIIENIHEGERQSFIKLLKLTQICFKEPRTCSIKNKDGMFVNKDFDLSRIDTNFHVELHPGHGIPRSPGDQMIFLTELQNAGLLQADLESPEKRYKLFKIYSGLNHLGALHDNEQKAEDYADAENKKMAKGKEAATEHYDIHYVHLDVHYRFMRTEKYDALAETTKDIFKKHTDKHAGFMPENLLKIIEGQQTQLEELKGAMPEIAQQAQEQGERGVMDEMLKEVEDSPELQEALAGLPTGEEAEGAVQREQPA